MQVKCARCGRIVEVPEGAALPCVCGVMVAAPAGVLERRCPRCGAEIPFNTENCLRCGTVAAAPVRGPRLGTAVARAKIIWTVFCLLLVAAAGYGIWKLVPRGTGEVADAPAPARPKRRPPGAPLSPVRKTAPPGAPAAKPAAPAGPSARAEAKPEEKIDVIKKRFEDAVELVETGDGAKRTRGIRVIRGLATRAIPFMRKELKTAGPEVRSAIATAMGRIGNVSLIGDLATLMDDPSEEVRVAAWNAMACFGPKASPMLKTCLESASEHVRTGAVRAIEKVPLSRLGYVALRKASDPSVEVRLAVAETFGGRLWSVEAADALIDLLEDPDDDVAWAAQLSLAEHVAELEERLARALAQLGEGGALLCGMALISAGTRGGMKDLARRTGGGEEVLLATTDAIRQGILLRMVEEETKDPALVGTVACLCAEPNARVRRRAATLLGGFQTEKAYRPMVSLLASSDVVLALSCARVLARSQGGAKELRRAVASRYRHRAVLAQAVTVLRRPEAPVMEDLLGCLSEDGIDARVKGFVAAALGSAPSPKVREALGRTASDESARTVARIYAAMACCKLGAGGEQFEFLLKELRTSHLKGVEVEQVVENQLAAASALGELGDERAVAPLIEVLNSHLSGVKVQAACIEALGKIGGKRATEVLLGLLVGQHQTVARAVLTALNEVGKEAVPPLRHLLRSPDEKVRLGALEAIEEIGAKELLPDVITLVEDPRSPHPARLRAVRVATALGGTAVAPPMTAGGAVAVRRAPAPQPKPIERPLSHVSKELRECKAVGETHEYEDALEALREILPRARNKVEEAQLKKLEAGYEAGVMLKELILERGADQHPRVYIDFADRPTSGVLLSVDEDGVVVRITGGEIPFPWKQISTYRFAGIANKFVSEDSFEELWGLADYCRMVGRDEMGREARAKAIKAKRE